MDNLFVAIIGGVVVFSISQYLQRFIFEPILSFRKTLSEISHILLLNQAKIMSGDADDEQLKDDFHTLSATLRSFSKVIPFYCFIQKIKLFGLPTEEDLLSASHCLNTIGYGVWGLGVPKQKNASLNIKALGAIGILLNIETTYAEPVDKPHK